MRAFKPLLILFVSILCFGARAQITPAVFSPPFEQWSVFGESDLFEAADTGLSVTWDSSRSNSFCYYPLGLTLSPAEHFRLVFTVRLSEVSVGTADGKRSTFQIAAGLLNTSNAFDSALEIGSGVNPAHGPRNLVEWNYFPEAGIISSTVAEIIATETNQIAYSHNFPLELDTGVWYRFTMEFSPGDQTLRLQMEQGADTNSFGAPEPLRDLVLGSAFEDFHVNALSISSYSDEGQPQFPGSIFARGTIGAVELTVYERPELEVSRVPGGAGITFETESGRTYYLERSIDTIHWQTVSDAVSGSGALVTVQVPTDQPASIFRVRAVRP